MFEKLMEQVQEAMTAYIDAIIMKNELRSMIYDYDANPSQEMRDALFDASWAATVRHLDYINIFGDAMRNIGGLYWYYYTELYCYFDDLIDDVIGDYYFGE